MLQASFGHIKQLYDLELGMPLKMAYKLCDKVLHPATIEQTNVSLADACFHESTIHALRYYSSNGFPEFSRTAEVLQIFRNWFNIVNVKSLSSKALTKDEYRAAITKEDREVINFSINLSIG